MNWKVILFAGGKCKKALRNSSGVDYRALIKLQSKPIILPALKSFMESSDVDEISIYAPDGLEKSLKPFLGNDIKKINFLKLHKEGLSSQVKDAISKYKKDDNLVLAAADLPLATSSAIASLLKSAESLPGIVYPLIPKSALDLNLVKNRTYLKTSDGQFTGGNVIVGKIHEFERVVDFLDNLIENRKNPIALAKMIGIGFVVGIVFGKKSLENISMEIKNRLKINLTFYQTNAFGLGVDLDKLSDYLVFQEFFDES
tara:strand:+ start:1428 stop:2198 length:771 start_codon:yes stop_codon:yes gene_type:complete